MLKASKDYLEKATTLLDVPIKSSSINDFPEGWTKIFYKKYPRFDRKPLDIDTTITPLNQLLSKRESLREFTGLPISLRKISNTLFWSCGEKPNLKNTSFPRRFYPSGGGRYPLELYLVAIKVGDLESGLYHYDIRENSLEVIIRGDVFADILKSIFSRFESASAFVILTSAMSRTEIKYGTKSLMMCLIEAGHVGQNIYLKCCEEGISCCSIIGFDRNTVSRFLDLDSEEEVPIYCFALGTTNHGGK